MKKSKIVICLLVIIILVLSVICILFATGKIKINNNENTQTAQKDDSTNYSGTFINEDSSSIVITKDNSNYKAEISIFRLASFDDGIVTDIKDDVLFISATDPNGNKIKFSFNYKTKILTVIETSWSLLNDGDTFEFNK